MAHNMKGQPEMPKYKAGLREAINENVQSIKNVRILRELYKITDIMARMADNERYKTLTDEEWNKSFIISDIANAEDARKISNIKCFVSVMLNGAVRGKAAQA